MITKELDRREKERQRERASLSILIYAGTIRCPLGIVLGFPGGASGKEPAGDVRDAGSIPGSGRCPGERHGNPLQYVCLANTMDRGAGWATVHRVAKSQTRLKWLSTHAQGQHRDFNRKYRWDHHNVAVTSLGNAHSSCPSKQIKDPSALVWTSHLSSSLLSILRPFCTKERDYFQHT